MVWPFLLRLPILRFSLSYGSYPCGFSLRTPISGGTCVCVGFLLRRRSCVVFFSSCWVQGRLLLRLFWCGFCASCWGACIFPRRVLRLVTLAGSATCLDPVGKPNPAVAVGCCVGGVLVHHLVFYLVPAQLPLRCLPLAGYAPFWLQFAGLLLRWSLVVGLEVSLVRRWVLYLVHAPPPGPAVCAAYPAAVSPWGFLTFLSPGVCPSATLVASVGQQPFPFLFFFFFFFFFASPAPAGSRGFAGFCTLCWPAVAKASVSCEVAV